MPLPVTLRLNDYLGPRVDDGDEELHMLAACESWHAAMRARGRTAGSPDHFGLDLLNAAHENMAYAVAKRAIETYCRMHRREQPGSAAMDECSERQSRADATEPDVPTSSLKLAASKVEQTVREAFQHGRTPTSQDVDMITGKLKKLRE